MRRVHIIGRKNSGKTTLVVDLVHHLTDCGVRVATIKHTHHRHELDVPGKDSHRHRQAGAHAVGILSPAMNAVFWPAQVHDSAESMTPHHGKYAAFESLFAEFDIVLVEGDSQSEAPKVEVWRDVLGEPPLATSDSSIRALVTDGKLPDNHRPIHILKRSDVPSIADFLMKLA